MQKSAVSTADLYDTHSKSVQVCESAFRDFGNKTDFTGPIRTLKVFEDFLLIKETLENAEALAGIAFCQMVRVGTPVTYGGFVSKADMKRGAPTFGTPEDVKTTLVIGQMARRYNLPYRSANANASNAVDAQAAYESQMCLWACLMSSATYVYHGLGWLEGGLSASFEKFIVDAEMIQGLTEVLKPIDLSAKELAVDVIGQIPPGGHFFGSNHTIESYEQAFYHPMLSDWRNFETWNESGAMDQDIALALDEFVARRESQGGAPVQ